MDASYTIKDDLNKFLLRLLSPKYNLYFIQHPVRNSIFQEISAVIFFKKDYRNNVEEIKNRYKNENFIDNSGLIEACIIIRKHNNKNIIKLILV